MGKIIAISNQKGGVGKSTTAINLSACLAERLKKVLIIDLDPQGNTTSGLGINREEAENTVYELLIGDASAEECTVRTAFGRLYVIPSNVDLAGGEIELMEMKNREYLLKNALDPIKEDYDYILIDCPPALSLLSGGQRSDPRAVRILRAGGTDTADENHQPRAGATQRRPENQRHCLYDVRCAHKPLG